MGQKVTCITKSGNKLEHITEIGVEGGTRYTVEKAIEMIRLDQKAFHTNSPVMGPFLRVATSASGLLYVRTTKDEVFSDNLLALPNCP